MSDCKFADKCGGGHTTVEHHLHVYERIIQEHCGIEAYNDIVDGYNDLKKENKRLDEYVDSLIQCTEHYSGTEDHINHLEVEIDELKEKLGAANDRTKNAEAHEILAQSELERLKTKKHKLFVIGHIGMKNAYLDVSREEALRRANEYDKEYGYSYTDDDIDEIEFIDELYAYEIWSGK
jgi:chromosome segregation ATPase